MSLCCPSGRLLWKLNSEYVIKYDKLCLPSIVLSAAFHFGGIRNSLCCDGHEIIKIYRHLECYFFNTLDSIWVA